MIEQTFLSKRPVVEPPVYTKTTWASAKENAQAIARKITVSEYIRRDDIVKQAWQRCKLYKGTTAWPTVSKGYAKYGECTIVGVCSSYADFSMDSKWPENDCPMIVSFYSNKNPSNHMICTWDYLDTVDTFASTC